jgi:universal stress protein F
MYKNILLPIDIEDKKGWKSSFNVAINLVKTVPDAKLHITTVVPNYGLGLIEEYFPKGWAKEISKKTLEKLQEIVKQFVPEEIQTVISIERGVVYQSIIKKAGETGADLIIMSAHHPDRRDYLLGPNVARVVRHADISVLVVREE